MIKTIDLFSIIKKRILITDQTLLDIDEFL